MTRRPTTPGGVELLWLTARECSEGETELLKALSQANARVQELEKFMTAMDLGDIRSRCHEAEARVKELEAKQDVAGIKHVWRVEAEEQTARVAVLREALEDAMLGGTGEKGTRALAVLDPAATTLADFALEVDEWIGPVLLGLPAAVADKLIAWRRARP